MSIGVNNSGKLVGARAFVRSLNILLKSVRLYGVEHGRAAAQLNTAWDELRRLLGEGDAGFLLGVSGTQLLVDGVPLDAGPAERSFAELLSAAGLASIQFSSRVTQEDFRDFIRAFAATGGKSTGLAEQLKQALTTTGEATIRINEVRFVAEDASLAGEGRMAAQITAQSLGADANQLQGWLSDPQKLLQLITAAQGARSGTVTGLVAGPLAPSQSVHNGSAAVLAGQAAPATDGGFVPSSSASAPGGPPAAGPVREEDVMNLLRLVTDMARSTRGAAGETAARLPQQLAELPATAQEMFRQALGALAAVTPTVRPDTPMLLQLAEHLAIRFALERFERGEVRVNAVREMLERSSRELTSLRKVLAAHEERMARAGLTAESHTDIMDRQFWAAVPESGKRAVLLSSEAWCVPPRNVRQFVEQLLQKAEQEAGSILLNYASGVGSREPEARRKTSAGLAELAGLYARAEGRLLAAALRCVGEQLRREPDSELQSQLSATFVRLSQEAGNRRDYAALNTALTSLDRVAGDRPGVTEALRPRVGVEDRLPEFVEEGLRETRVPPELAALLHRTPRPAAAQMAARFNRCARREECSRLVELFRETGAEGVAHLREVLRYGPVAEASSTIGLLSRFDADALEDILPARLSGWNRFYHDIAVRQLAFGDSPDRGRLLVRIFPALDSMTLPEALDEIGLSGDSTTAGFLLRLAGGEMPQAADPFLRVKAMEALGRLRAASADALLRSTVEARQMFRWRHAEELRTVAAQALERIDPEWARDFLPRSGLDSKELALAPLDAAPDAPWARQRRYSRVALPRAISAVASTMRGDVRLDATTLSLGGGMASAEAKLAPGTQASVRLRSGLRNLQAEVVVRDTMQQQVGFEIVEIGLEDRSKLRRLIAGFAAPAAA